VLSGVEIISLSEYAASEKRFFIELTETNAEAGQRQRVT
jgi:hypothetical protein